MVECACGCGEVLDETDNRGRARQYLHGHNGRGKQLPSFKCGECGTTTPRSGPGRGCKGLCRKCYGRQRWLNQKESDYEEVKRVRRECARRLRQRLLDFFGRRCACCGETRQEFLSLDHINGGGNKHNRLRNGSHGVYRDALNDPEARNKYRLLCHNCNFARGHYGYCPHEREDQDGIRREEIDTQGSSCRSAA
jgi:hypothetical protein